MAETAARSAIVVWDLSRAVDVRNMDVTMVRETDTGADVRAEFELRVPPSGLWERVEIIVPVIRNDDNGWSVPATQTIDRLVASNRSATTIDTARASQTPTAEPTPTPPPTPTLVPLEIPPPPEGLVVYESDWSDGLDGWIGPFDWTTAEGMLLNDGTRAGREPWIEAPIKVDPWESMVVEMIVELRSEDFGSFGLMARGSDAGWLQLGMRFEQVVAQPPEDPTVEGTGQPEEDQPVEPLPGVAISLGATIREFTERVQQEWFTVPYTLTPGRHLYRFEFVADEISMFIDGVEVGEVLDNTFAAGEILGLWSDRASLIVGFFRVTIV